MAHEKRPLNVIFNIHITRSSNQLEIDFLPEGAARAAVVWTTPGHPHGTGVPRVLNNTSKRRCARRRSPLVRRRSRRTREGGSGGSPLYLAAGAAPGRASVDRVPDTLCTPLAGRFLHSGLWREGRKTGSDIRTRWLSPRTTDIGSAAGIGSAFPRRTEKCGLASSLAPGS